MLLLTLPFMRCRKRRIVEMADGVADSDAATVAQAGGGWTSWTPTYSANYTSVTTEYAKYRRVGNRVEFILRAIGTTGAAPGDTLTFTLPVTMADANGGVFTAWGGDGGTSIAGWSYPATTTVCNFSLYNSANFTTGANRRMSVSGFYEV